MSILKILVIEDSPTDCELVLREIRKSGIEFSEMVVETSDEFIHALENFKPDLILSDYALPEFDGMKALMIQQKMAHDIPFILVTGSVNEETAVECMKAGADDYVIKQNLKRLGEAIKGALEKKQLIREKKAYEAILIQSESRYRSLFENSAVPIFEEDFSAVKAFFDELANNGITDYRAYFDAHPEEIVRCTSLIKIIDVNDESLRFFNAEKKSDILDDMMTGFLDETWPFFKEEIIALAEGKTFFESEIPISTFNWEHKHVILKLSVRPDSHDTLKHVFISFVDITARKEAQAALAESEELFRIASENAMIGVCMMTPEGRFMFVNKAINDLWGYDKEELSDLNFSDILHPDDQKSGMELLAQLASGEIQHSNYEQKYRHKSGSVIWASVSTGIIHSSIRRKDYFVFYIQDITSRKEAEISLRRSADLYCTLTENMKDVVWILDPDTLRFRYISPSAKKMVGFTAEEIMTLSMTEVVAPEYREKLIADLRKMINDCASGLEKQGTYHTQVIKQPCKDGSFIWAEITAYTYANEETGQLEIRGTHRDITERKLAEEMLRKSEEKFRLLFEYAADPIQLLDDQLHFVDCNEATLRILGIHKKEQFLSNNPSMISPEFQPDGQPSLEKSITLVKNAFELGTHQFEWVHKRANGELFTVDINLTRIQMEGKNLLLVHMRDITTRKQMEERLREREKSLSMLINSMPDIVCFKDGEGRWLEANSFDLELFQLTEVDYRGKKDSELAQYNEFYKEAFRNCEKSDEIAWLKGDQVRGDEVIPRPDGTELIFDVIKVPSFDENGNRAGLLVIGRDITKRKVIEDALLKSEEKFRILAEHASDVIWTMDIHGKNTYMSPSILRLRGYTPEEAMSQTTAESLTPETAARAEAFLSDAIAKIEKGENFDNYSLELEQPCKDGSTVWVEATVSGIFDEKGKFISFLGVSRNITDRRNAEELLRERQYWLSESQRVGRIGSYSIDILNDCWSSSEVLDEILGIDTNIEKNLRSWLGFTHPDHKEDIQNYLLEEVLGKRLDFNKEYKIIRANDGVERWVWGKGELTFDESGEAIKMIGTLLDITDRKMVEEALIDAKNKAEENDRLKTAFLNNISHEIRTPMNAIIGFSGFLNDPALTDDKRKYFTEIICNASNHLLSIITDIINIATIEAGQETIKKSKVNINHILHNLHNQFEIKAIGQHLRLKCETPLPDEEMHLETDETKLTQVLSNLLGNSMKFTRQGHITFGYTLKDHNIEFYVEDTGIGIPAHLHTEIFDRFRQADSTIARQFGGTGLGLSISKAYVELLGGKIWLKSAPGQGSKFFFTLPFELSRNGHHKDSASENDNFLSFDSTKTLLVAEDEDLNFMLLDQLLSNQHFNLIRVVNGAEAVHVCKTNPAIDLVLMDVKMPVMDGYEASRLIKEQFPHLPIIMQTAYARESDKQKAFECGCDGYIAKPIIINEFLELLKTHLNKEEIPVSP